MEFKQAVITKQGRELMAKLLAGKNTKFTKIAVSSTVYQDNQLEALTALTNVKQTTEAQAYSNNQATVAVVGALENTGLTAGYYINTVGLFASDPDKGEILYSVSSASVNGYMPPDTGVSKSGVELKIYTEVSNASQVNLTVDPAAYATRSDLEIFEENYRNKTQSDIAIVGFVSGSKKIKLQMVHNFKDKIVGDDVSNPHISYAGLATWSEIKTPSSTWYLNPQNVVGPIQNKDNKLSYIVERTNNTIAQALFKFNLLKDWQLVLGEEFDINSFKKSMLVDYEFGGFWGIGFGSEGSKLTSTLWDFKKSEWSENSKVENLSESIINLYEGKKWDADMKTDFISDEGILYMNLYSSKANEENSTRISLNYVEVRTEIEIELDDIFKVSEMKKAIADIQEWIQQHS